MEFCFCLRSSPLHENIMCNGQPVQLNRFALPVHKTLLNVKRIISDICYGCCCTKTRVKLANQNSLKRKERKEPINDAKEINLANQTTQAVKSTGHQCHRHHLESGENMEPIRNEPLRHG